MPTKPETTAGRLDRAKGCFMGHLVGDALGATTEFKAPWEIQLHFPNGVKEMVGGGHDGLAPGQITDDSEMAIALIRSIVKEKGYDRDAVRQAYVNWKNTNPFGMGGTVRKGLDGRPQYESQANGAMMRVSPIGIWGATSKNNVMLSVAYAKQDAEITHLNPICVQANMLFVMALSASIRLDNPRPKAIYNMILTNAQGPGTEPALMDAIEKAATEPPADYMMNMGWVVTAFHNALYLLLHADSVEEGLVFTVNQGGDADTNAAIAGALLGATYGMTSIPRRWVDAVLACKPGETPTRYPRPTWLWPTDAMELVEKIMKLA